MLMSDFPFVILEKKTELLKTYTKVVYNLSAMDGNYQKQQKTKRKTKYKKPRAGLGKYQSSRNGGRGLSKIYIFLETPI